MPNNGDSAAMDIEKVWQGDGGVNNDQLNLRGRLFCGKRYPDPSLPDFRPFGLSRCQKPVRQTTRFGVGSLAGPRALRTLLPAAVLNSLNLLVTALQSVVFRERLQQTTSWSPPCLILFMFMFSLFFLLSQLTFT